MHGSWEGRYLLEHDGVVVIDTSSLWEYKKRIIISPFNMLPKPEKEIVL